MTSCLLLEDSEDLTSLSESSSSHKESVSHKETESDSTSLSESSSSNSESVSHKENESSWTCFGKVDLV
jgi:hypothetical protein